MTRLHPALVLAAALCLGAPRLAAQVSPPNPFAVERAERNADDWHSRHGRRHEHARWRLERRGERLERRGDRIEHQGWRWERHGKRLERRGHEYRGRMWQRKGERLQHRGDRLEHRGDRLERRGERPRAWRHVRHGDGDI
jgi:hypothetical protein